MAKRILIFDVSSICHRALHTTGDLESDGIKTGVLFGFFEKLVILSEKFEPTCTAFAFDYGESFRTNHFREYKKERKEKIKLASEEEKEARREMHRQIRALRTEYLKEMGYKNILYRDGYEADDIIGSICLESAEDKLTEITIVSSDSDLYQLVSGNCRMWNVGKKNLITLQSFKKEYGISPKQWMKVKALAGDTTDGIPGVEGVGKKTAIKFLQLNLSKTSKAYENIEKFVKEGAFERNIDLIKLPFPGTPMYELKEDKLSASKWKKIAKQLRMSSLKNKPPYGAR